MFKVKHKKTKQIYQVLDTWFDELFHTTYFLIWENNGWRWRSAANYVPPNTEVEDD